MSVSFPLSTYPWLVWLGLVVALFLGFEETSHCFPLAPHPCQHLLLYVLSVITFLTGLKWNLIAVWFEFSWWLQKLRKFSYIYWEVSIKILCPFFLGFLGFWYVFWLISMFWILTVSWMTSQWIFSAVSSLCGLFPLLYKSFFSWYNTICQFLLLLLCFWGPS
jgi:hypothetical protein